VAPILHWRTTVARLSVCLIVKNEERHLGRCLESVRGLADEIVVVDTGSSDRTVAIAREHGARVTHFTWCDDFSAAKNFSIEQATGDWILSIDADESIATRDHSAIRATVEADAVDAVVVAQRHYVDTVLVGWQSGSGGYAEGEPYGGFIDVDCRRLFRNHPCLRFRNRVHEELVSLDSARPFIEARGTWVLHHYGKTDGAERLLSKGEAYLRIGRKKVEEQPHDPQAHYELGVQFAELKQPDEAIGSFERALALSPNFRDAQLRLALCHLDAKQYRAALQALRDCHRLLPRRRAEVALTEGNAHRELGDLRRAAQAFRRALKENPALAPASMNLALLYTRERRYDEALACLDRAVKQAPRDIRLRSLRGHVRCDAGDEAGALADLQCAAGDIPATRLRARILVRQRRFEAARASLVGVDTSTDAELAGLHGAVALGLGNVAEAVTRLEESLRIEPTVDAALNLSTALQSQGARTEAFRAAAQALGIVPSNQAAQTRFAQFAGNQFHDRRDPGNKTLTFAFYQPHSLDYDGSTPRERGLGGTESAVVYLAESLARRGHRCIVFNGCSRERDVNAVEYVRWEAMPDRSITDRPDVLVAVRSWDLIGRLRLAPLQIFWTGDAFDQPFVQALSRTEARAEIDFFMLQSDWHTTTFQTHHAVPSTQIIKTTLGAAASANVDTRPAVSATRPRRLAYVSTPFRGLDVLLEMFPRLRASFTDLRLDVFSSMKVYGWTPEADQKAFGTLYDAAVQRGVTWHGSLAQPELLEHLGRTGLFLYPNTFAETSCIAAIEAQASGCVVVTSARAALNETVEHGKTGICIKGEPKTEEYQREFIGIISALLRNPARMAAFSEAATQRAFQQYTWKSIASEWTNIFESMPATAVHGRWSGPLTLLQKTNDYLEKGNVSAATRVLTALERTPFLRSEVEAVKGKLSTWM